MAELTKKEYAKECGILTKHLSTYIKRGKVFMTKEGMISMENELNVAFLQSKQGLEEEAKPKAKVVKKKVGKKSTVEAVATTEEGVRYQEAMLRYNTEKRKAELDIQIKEHTEEEKRMKNEKARREVVPTVLMRAVLSSYSTATRQAYYDGLDAFIILLTHKVKLNSTDESNFRKQLNEVINTSDAKALEIAKKAVEAIVDEYSTTRGVGESK